MLRSFAAVAVAGVALLAACNPTFNWREVRAAPTTLKTLMPCKPEREMRQVDMAGRQVELQALGCETGGAIFAVMFADIGEADRAGQALEHWKTASLANVRGSAEQATPFSPPGALALAQSLRVTASGQRPDGSKLQSQAAYFAHGRHVFQAVILGSNVNADMAEPFFSGLRFE
jgi:hypothetical protein